MRLPVHIEPPHQALHSSGHRSHEWFFRCETLRTSDRLVFRWFFLSETSRYSIDQDTEGAGKYPVDLGVGNYLVLISDKIKVF